METKNLSLGNEAFPIRATRVFQDSLVPWEVAGYAEDARIAASTGGFFDLSHWGVVEVLGPDAADFLQRMSTWDLKRAQPHYIHHGAFRPGKAQPIALGIFEAVEGGFHFLTPGPAARAAAEHLETFHFAENLTVTDRSAEWAVFGLWRSLDSLGAALDIPADAEPLREYRVALTSIPHVAWKDDSRRGLIWVKIRKDTAPRFFALAAALQVPLLGHRLFERFRIAAAVPEIGVDLTEKELVLEANFDRAVARNKGCYPGQEVVERIFTYGQVNKKLWPVSLELGPESSAGFPKAPFPLDGDGKTVGTVASFAESPERPGEALGLAYLRKQVWDSGAVLTAVPGITVRRRDVPG